MLGDRIKEMRLQKELTQTALAEMIHSSAANISKYENEITEPPADTLRLIALALDTTVDYLVGMPDAPVSRKAQTSPEFSKIIEVTADFSKSETAKLLDYAIMLKKSR